MFIVSAGILPYPITFLVTDILSEIYGRDKTNKVVFSGFIASLFVLLFLWLGAQFNSIDGSPVSDSVYNKVFQNAWRVIAASMIAYLSAQFLDVRLFHFWKKLTNGKHLWFRNNASTMFSQFIDTAVVLSLLCYFNVLDWSMFSQLLLNGFLFKVLFAALDTPIIYGILFFARKKFKLRFGEELS